MKVSVRGFAVFRDILRSTDLEIETEVKTVGQLVDELSERISQHLKEALIDGSTNSVLHGNKILINGRDVPHLDGLATELQKGDRVVFFPPVGGGS